jgi:hypothetical protein
MFSGLVRKLLVKIILSLGSQGSAYDIVLQSTNGVNDLRFRLTTNRRTTEIDYHETDMICKGKEEVREREERASCGGEMFRRSLASDLVW